MVVATPAPLPAGIYYPRCQCSNDGTGLLCDTSGMEKPHQFHLLTGDVLLDVSGDLLEPYLLYTTDYYKLHRYDS